jgi:hypothetical protein
MDWKMLSTWSASFFNSFTIVEGTQRTLVADLRCTQLLVNQNPPKFDFKNTSKFEKRSFSKKFKFPIVFYMYKELGARIPN